MKYKLKDKGVFYLEFSAPKLSLCFDCKSSEDTNNFSSSVPQSRVHTALKNDNVHVHGGKTFRIIADGRFFNLLVLIKDDEDVLEDTMSFPF